MQDNNRDMPIVDKDLYFVIEEKNNQVDLTDKGVEYMSQETLIQLLRSSGYRN
jgi:preprotein translocase subunit SecA